MANQLDSNTSEKLLRKFTDNFVSNTVLYQTTDRELVEDYDATTGGTVKMKRPTRYVPQRTADGDMTAASINPINVGSVTGEVGEYITVFTEMTDLERALELDQLDELLAPIAEDMAVELETEIGNRMAKNAALVSGDPDKAIATWSDIAYAGANLKAIGAPSGERFCAISDFDETKLADVQSGLGVNPEVGSAWDSAMIRERFAGFNRVFSTNNLPEVIHGDEASATLTLSATPTQTYAVSKDSYQMLLSFSGGTAAGVLKAGQQLTVDSKYLINMRNRKVVVSQNQVNKPFTFTVLEDNTADGSGNYTGVKVSGASIFETGVNAAFNTISAALASGDTFNVLGTASKNYRPALAYCRGFFGVGSVKLQKLYNKDSRVLNMPNMGLSIRLTMDADTIANKNMARWDMLPTFACYNPFLGMHVSGN